MKRQHFGLSLIGIVVLLLSVGLVLADTTVREHYHTEGIDTFYCDVNGDWVEDYTVTAHFKGNFILTTTFNEVGVPVSFLLNGTFNATITNDDTGEFILDHQRNKIFQDFQTGGFTVNRTWNVRIPYMGSHVHEVGRIIFDPSAGGIVFLAGQHPVIENPNAYDFCAMLGSGRQIGLVQGWRSVIPRG